ncbi:hypothetical protein DSCW_05850 [Desulfosarcina widdelii]|uniref:Uncharacterized protein n=1 Tax=Desulfosarcina widdelii TaxID=947919 RepID=A0A5K7YX22_9BACT|nr:hypothetical protein DSCW_05850 [Desulfosarcina widdelii]
MLDLFRPKLSAGLASFGQLKKNTITDIHLWLLIVSMHLYSKLLKSTQVKTMIVWKDEVLFAAY